MDRYKPTEIEIAEMANDLCVSYPTLSDEELRILLYRRKYAFMREAMVLEQLEKNNADDFYDEGIEWDDGADPYWGDSESGNQ